jgi:beta-glucosidase
VRVSAEHRSAAREIARKSIVLLRNEAGLLPLDKSAKRRILVTGPLADAPADMLGPWHARGRAEDTVSVLAGVRAHAGSVVSFEEGVGLDPKGHPVTGDETRIAKAVAAARDSDLVIAVVGERETQSGEAKNRAHLDLPGRQSELLDALRETGKPLVVVLITGRALAVPRLFENSGTLVHAFFPGTEAGHAIADVLFGDFNPGGKMPVTWPRSVGQIPIHHYDPPNGRPNIPERGDYKAHWLDEADAPLVPFGYGLSYTRFALEALEVPARAGSDGLIVRLRVRNLGARAGHEVPQVYLRPKVASTVTGKRLAAYRRVHVPAGGSVPIEFRIPAEQLTVLDRENRWTRSAGAWEVIVGTDSASGLTSTFIAN